ncbi:MAG: SET domain-containing protein [Nanoarchaeota archaeon]|nr:SET domain-containing protein [Nanoarchaeota archaeon]
MDLILEQSKLGKAVFANKDFKKGEEIIEFRGKIFDYNEIDDNSYEDEHCIQIGKRTYIGPSGELDDFINHSCNPNSGIKVIGKRVILITIKDIKEGEEITWDYSTALNEDHWEMDCMCQSKNCRKRIRDFKYLPKEIQQKYIKLGIVPKYILENLKRNPE